MTDFYSRLDQARQAVTAAEQETSDIQQGFRTLQEQENFTQDLHRRQRRLFETISGCWQGRNTVKTLQGYSDRAERLHRQATETIRQEHEKLLRQRRQAEDRYDQAVRRYHTINAER